MSIHRYVPELANFPVEFLYEPWKAPLDVQKKAGCIIGKDYPSPIVDHERASQRNINLMDDLKQTLLKEMCKVIILKFTN